MKIIRTKIMKWIDKFFAKKSSGGKVDVNVLAIKEIQRIAENMEVHPTIRVVCLALLGSIARSPESTFTLALICQEYARVFLQEQIASINNTANSGVNIH